MKKRILSLLLVICLCIGLLPVIALADEAAPKKVALRIMSWTDIEAEEGGAIGYLKNQEYTAYTAVTDAEGNITGYEEVSAWKQVKGDADNWNVKFEWPAGGVPTLTVKDSKMSMCTKEGKFFYTKSIDKETQEEVYTKAKDTSAILPKSGAANQIDLNLVVEGENMMMTNYGVIRGSVSDSQYFKNITVTGKDGAKISGRGGTIGISAKAGYNLTIENVNIEMTTTQTGGGSPIPIRTEKGNITIKNSTIKCGNEKNVAIQAATSGDITIIDSTINVTSKLSSTAGSACITATGGTITIEGSKTHITAVGKNNPCLNAAKIIINGGLMDFTSAYYAIYTKGAEDCTINGGTINIMAERAFFSAFVKGDKVKAYSGASADSCQEYDGTTPNLAKQPWMLITDDASKFIEITEPEETTPIFTVPTQPATTPSTPVATTPTTPTTPVSGGNNNGSQNNGSQNNGSQTGNETTAATGTGDANESKDEGGSDAILWIVIVVVVLAAGGAIAFILIKRKKA